MILLLFIKHFMIKQKIRNNFRMEIQYDQLFIQLKKFV